MRKKDAIRLLTQEEGSYGTIKDTKIVVYPEDIKFNVRIHGDINIHFIQDFQGVRGGMIQGWTLKDVKLALRKD